MQFIGLFIAAGLGLWAWSDAKNLERRSIRVGSFSPVAWGWLVALLAIVFGIMYLVQRPKAIAQGEAGRLQAWQNAPPDIVDIPTDTFDADRLRARCRRHLRRLQPCRKGRVRYPPRRVPTCGTARRAARRSARTRATAGLRP